MSQRVALYSPTETISIEALIRAARLAERGGGRVVTIVSEDNKPAGPVLTTELLNLLQRVRGGEIDKIIACVNRREWRRALKLNTQLLKKPTGGAR